MSGLLDNCPGPVPFLQHCDTENNVTFIPNPCNCSRYFQCEFENVAQDFPCETKGYIFDPCSNL